MIAFRLALVLALTLAPALRAEDTAASAPAPAVSGLPAITVSTVVGAPVTDRIYASGLIGPVESVLVQPQIQGQAIEQVMAEVGDTVTEGQVLAQLSGTELTLQKSQLVASRAAAAAAIAQSEAQLVEAKSNADEADRTRTRADALRKTGTMSQAALDDAVAAAISARARVSVATQGLEAAKAQATLVEAQVADVDLKLKRTAVVAPVAGKVVEKNAMVGAIASSAGPAMFSIVKDGALELMADVAEQDILKLKPGQQATLTFVGLARPIQGTVRLVEPQVDAVSRLGRVRISVADSADVRSGMFASAQIVAAEKSALVIPVSAAGGDTSGSVALKVDAGVVHVTPIITGIRDGGLVEVSSGLAAGDEVVTKAGAFVRDGDHINPVADDARVVAKN